MKIGIVVCSRTDSKRIPNKPLVEINGKQLIYHLTRRLRQSGLSTIVAVPSDQASDYRLPSNIILHLSDEYYPLARMREVAAVFELDHVVRVNHDKLFVDPSEILSAIDFHMKRANDYTVCPNMTAGMGFEIISTNALRSAADRFEKVEHVSYAIKAVTDSVGYYITEKLYSKYRLLIDYPEDLTLIRLIIKSLGNDCTPRRVIKFIRQNVWVESINKLPEVTFYTCGYNSGEWIEQCMKSVKDQRIFNRSEYILVDDDSSDKTFEKMCRFKSHKSNVQVYANDRNEGLASSSNVALSKARGKYIIRMDADDYFTSPNAVLDMIDEMGIQGCDALYPNNYYGSPNKVQRGCEQHHVGGALFKTSAVNHIKFTEGLRGYEGLDFFERAKDSIRFGYYNRPLFYYRQHAASLSKNNLKERELIINAILNKYLRED